MSGAGSKVDQARALLEGGAYAEAAALLQQLVRVMPRDAGVAAMLSDANLMQGNLPQAAFFAQRAVELAPLDAGCVHRLARVYTVQGKMDDARKALEKAAAKMPGDAGVWGALAGAYQGVNLPTRAVEAARAGLKIAPGDAGLMGSLAGGLLNCGRPEEAAAVLGEVAERHGGAHVLNGRALMMNYIPGVAREEVLEAHRAYGRELERTLGPAPARVFANSRDHEKRLRVGIVSPDLRAHSVAFFIEPFFEHHDRELVEVVAYQTNTVSDAVTERLKRYPGVQWRRADTLDDSALAAQVLADGVDVLVELSGHTHGHSLSALHQRCAPVQVTYLGYPNTTGVAGVDYRIVDSVTDPEGAEAWHTERLLRVDPCFLCYRPPVDAPEPAARKEGPVVFGSFNTVQKINAPLMELWARVLGAVPESRLVLKSINFADERLRAEFLARFAAAGIDKERLELLPPVKAQGGHLKAYEKIDIALDPHPYNGTTTTCEALWMGVPVVTLKGDRHASRVGASLMTAVGLADLIADNGDRYVAVASALAADGPRRAELRRTLRRQVAASALCDGAGFSRHFEGALRGAWRAWAL